MENQKSFLEDIVMDKPESFRDEVFIPARKGPGRIIAAVIAAIVIPVLIFIWLQIGKITVPDMTSWQFSEVQDWVSRYHENTVLNGVYNKDIPLNKIISQDLDPGVKIDKNSRFTLTYSLGADPEEAVTIPDLKNMPLGDIKSWIEDNQMSGVTIQYESSDIIPENGVISLEYVEGSQELFLRKNRMIIYVSTGAQNMDETIEMEDLYGKSRAELMQWSEENHIPVAVKEEFNQYVDYDKVYEQSIKADTKITHNDTVTVTISRGKPITVPDFTGMSRSEASDLSALHGITVFYQFVISSREADTVLNQDIQAGTQIDEQQIVTLEIAKEDGKIIVPDFKGLTRNEADSLAALYNIKLFVRNADEFGSSGIITSQTIAAGEKIDESQVISVLLKENDILAEVPDFSGMTKNEATIAAQELDLQLLFDETETTKTTDQYVISQSIKAKTKVKQGDTILLNIAKNSGIKAADVLDMDLNEAEAWAAGKGINLNVIDYYSDDHPTGKLYYQDVDPGDCIPTNKVLTVYRSLGMVMADNFMDKTKSDIIKWKDEVNGKGADIKLQFFDDLDTSKAKGTITDQSICGELIKLGQTIQVWVSASDNGVIIKDFTGVSVDNFKLWCDKNNVPYIITDCYSDTVAADTVFGQTYTDTYLPEDDYLRVNHSLGKLYLPDFTNQTRSEMLDWQREVNSKQANIKINFVGSYTDAQSDKIIYQSVKDTEIGLGETITVIYSLG